MYQHLIAAAAAAKEPLPPVEAELVGGVAVLVALAVVYFVLKLLFGGAR